MSRRYVEELVARLYPAAERERQPDPRLRSQSGRAGRVTGGGLNRRDFFRLTGAVGGGLLVAMYLPGCKRDGDADGRPEIDTLPNAFVRIGADNRVTVTVAKSEMGQGIRTTLALIVAEEMDLDWSKVQVEQAPEDFSTYGWQSTGASASVRTSWTPLRTIGAKSRAILLAAAAEKLGVEVAALTTENSHVIHAESGRKLPYSDLGELVAKHKAPEKVTLKDPKTFRLLGREHIGVDVGDIVTGAAVYGLDVRRDGMLFASLVRSPTVGGKVKRFDPASALAVKDVVKVVEIDAIGPDINVLSSVAVIAKNTWAATQGRAALDIEWELGPAESETSAAHSAEMKRLTADSGAEEINKLGDPDDVLEAADEVVRGEYELPRLAHATMEPMNCTAAMEGDRCVLWAPVQYPAWAVRAVAKALDIPTGKVDLQIPLLGGGFGRRINPDYVVEAAILAKQLGAPVQVVWTREDDTRHAYYRPPAMHVIEASLGQDGYPEAWRHRMSTAPINATNYPDREHHGLSESNGASDMLYQVPNRSLEYSRLQTSVRSGWWRAVHTTHTTFAVESFIDELAEKAGVDALEYRMKLIGPLQVDQPQPDKDFPWDPERLKGVLALVAEKAGWGGPVPAGHGVGLACAIDHLSYAAEAVEVSIEAGRLRIHKVVCAVDCGPVLNPNGARAQVEGAIIQGISAALQEQITVAGGRVEQGNFDTYPVLRINDAPVAIEAHFVERPDVHPTGLGEPALAPIAPALANAIYKATGRRHRVLPIGKLA